MSKICIALMGEPKLKNRFDTIFNQKDENGNWIYWRWNCNPNNIINRAVAFITKEIEVNGGDNVDKFIGIVSKNADKLLNFKEAYVNRMLQKFLEHEKAQILILHGLGQELTNKLYTEGKIHTVFLAEKEEVEINPNAEYTIVDGEDFEKSVLSILKTLEK